MSEGLRDNDIEGLFEMEPVKKVKTIEELDALIEKQNKEREEAANREKRKPRN